MINKAGHAFHEVWTINHDYDARLARTTDPAARQQIFTEDYQKGADAVVRNGLTVNEYNQVLALAGQNQTVRQKLLAAAGVNSQ